MADGADVKPNVKAEDGSTIQLVIKDQQGDICCLQIHHASALMLSILLSTWYVKLQVVRCISK